MPVLVGHSNPNGDPWLDEAKEFRRWWFRFLSYGAASQNQNN